MAALGDGEVDDDGEVEDPAAAIVEVRVDVRIPVTDGDDDVAVDVRVPVIEDAVDLVLESVDEVADDDNLDPAVVVAVVDVL